MSLLPEQKFDESVWHVLKKIKERSLYADTEKRVPYFIISDFSECTNTPCSPEDQIDILKKLNRDGVIKLTRPKPNKERLTPDIYVEIIQPAFNELYGLHYVFTNTKQQMREEKNNQKNKQFDEKIIKSMIPIKNVRLDKNNYLLEINHGEKIISFKSRKKKEGLEKETKQFKILYHLWDYRHELTDGKITQKGDFVSLDNLMKGSGAENTDATYKHVLRLNSIFKKANIAIKIKGENGKYRLLIMKG